MYLSAITLISDLDQQTSFAHFGEIEPVQIPRSYLPILLCKGDRSLS